MTKAKIAVTVPRALLANARRAVKQGRAASVSAYVSEALEEKAKIDDLKGMLDEMLDESGGPMTAAEQREADRMLRMVPARKRRPAA
jgi:Arc/MetJ-type ribon-helix-helix transcriptional regulator